MTTGWMLCLALVSQVPQYAPATTGWQPGGTAANNGAAQPVAAQPGVTHTFGQPSRFATSNSGQRQPMGVVQYAQPIGPSPYLAQQPQQLNPRFNNQPTYQVAQAQPQGAQNFASQQGQPTPAWGQPNPSPQPATQPAAPTLLAPQNARPTQSQGQYQPQTQPQSNWAAQPQQNQDALAGVQQSQNWQSHPTNGSQFSGGMNGRNVQSQQFAGAQPQITPPHYEPSQHINAQQQDSRRGDSSIGSGASGFGAPIDSRDNRNSLPLNDPRLGQPPATWPSIQANDAGQPYPPRLVANNGNDPSNQFNPPSGALHPTLHSTLPNGAEQPSDNRQGELTPYARAQPPRADGDPQASELTVADSRWADVNNFGQQGIANRIPNFVAGVRIGDSPNQRAGYTQPVNGRSAPRDGLFASVAGGNAGSGVSADDKLGNPSTAYNPSTAIVVSLIGLFFSLGANLYLGWIAFESHFRYRRLLVEGDDYDDTRRGGRDDEGGSRRR